MTVGARLGEALAVFGPTLPGFMNHDERRAQAKRTLIALATDRDLLTDDIVRGWPMLAHPALTNRQAHEAWLGLCVAVDAREALGSGALLPSEVIGNQPDLTLLEREQAADQELDRNVDRWADELVDGPVVHSSDLEALRARRHYEQLVADIHAINTTVYERVNGGLRALFPNAPDVDGHAESATEAPDDFSDAHDWASEASL